MNRNLPEAALDLSPGTYAPEMFRDSGVNLIQIGSQGREMQLAFEAPAQLVSTEKFLVPYVLEGEVRAYNQQMLERFEVRSLMIFFASRRRLRPGAGSTGERGTPDRSIAGCWLA